jgi:divalent metal cation (Fe/Co/Zn/Cd) transporter
MFLIISEAIHLIMDLAASFVAFFSLKQSAKPADRNHPYGYEKFENISGITEGLFTVDPNLTVKRPMILLEA